MFQGFRDFVLRGNVVDLAVAVVIGAAFSGIVTAFTEAVVNPLLAFAGGSEVPGFGPRLDPDNAATQVNIGVVLSAVLNFLIVAAVVYFLIVTPMNRLLTMRRRGEKPDVQAPTEDVLLLQDIRDLLRAQQQAGRPGGSPQPGVGGGPQPGVGGDPQPGQGGQEA